LQAVEVRGQPVVTVFLCGDVMTGRGVDQILPHPSDPRIHEEFVQDARAYVRLAEAVNGPVPRPVELSYIWGDSLAELQRVAPAARIVNVETSVTRSDDAWPKEITYRMHPANVGCLNTAGNAAAANVCVLANNHVLDYGYSGLVETLETLRRAGLSIAGAGRTLAQAREPATIELEAGSRVVVHAFGTETSGIPRSWAAADDLAGVAFLFDLSDETAAQVEEQVRRVKRSLDVTIASIHWGSNWGYEVLPEQVWFAHRLIDGGVDIVHGHSSHHPRAIEVYRKRLILYGCGDLINDYEGIRGHKQYRGDLSLLYFATVDPAGGELVQLRMVPMRIRKLALDRASARDATWLRGTLSRASSEFGSWFEWAEDGSLLLRWAGGPPS
jgi:poly-gamma-glutamate capsule biosynthesis protein CapA/YwtB (metallophosphatase superfamily)